MHSPPLMRWRSVNIRLKIRRGCLYTVELKKFVNPDLNATRRTGSGRGTDNLGTREIFGATRGSDTHVGSDIRVQHQGAEKEKGEKREGKETEEEGGLHARRKWSRQLRYQLRVQAVTRARRVKEERSGNRRVVGEVMSLAACGPGSDSSRDHDIRTSGHDIFLLRAEHSDSRLLACEERAGQCKA